MDRLERLHGQGKTRAIGVSNFDSTQIQALVDDAAIKPAINQLGYGIGHPQTQWMPASEIEPAVLKSKDLGVSVSAWGPLGRTTLQGVANVLGNPTLTSVAERHGKSSAQVALRWLVEQGVSVVTASNNARHYHEDLEVTDFSLNEHDIRELKDAF